VPSGVVGCVSVCLFHVSLCVYCISRLRLYNCEFHFKCYNGSALFRIKLRVKALPSAENFSGRLPTLLPQNPASKLYLDIQSLPTSRTEHNRTMELFSVELFL